MQMQIETRKADPVEDRGAFIGSVLACFLVLAALVVADIVFAAERWPHQLTQDEATKSPIAKADGS